MPKVAERGIYRRIYNRRFHIVSTGYIYFKKMQFISGFSKTGMMEVSRTRDQDIIQFVCPESLTKYHQNMNGVDQGYQLRKHGAGFTYKVHFKSGTNIGT